MLHRCLPRPVTSAWMPSSLEPARTSAIDLRQVHLALGRAGGDQVVELGVALRVQRREREVLELLLELLHAQAVRQRGVDVERLLGDALLLLARHRGDRAHVVQPVGELDDQHPQVAAIATSILRIVAACWASFESNWSRSSLVTPSTICRDLGPEALLDVGERDLGVLDRVVQQAAARRSRRARCRRRCGPPPAGG
jgi:hypothetical protein